MIQEALVIISCLNNKGCSQTSSAYYSMNESLQEYVQKQERQLKKAAGPLIIDYFLPLAATSMGRPFAVKLSKHYSVKLEDKQIQLSFTREW